GEAQGARQARVLDLTQTASTFAAISAAVAEDFRVVTGITWLSAVAFAVADSGALEINLTMDSGRQLQPTEILSESHLDLLALMIFVELHRELGSQCARRFVVLDDVFQS